MQCYYYSNESSSFMRTSIGCFCEGAFSNFISCDTVSRYTRCFSSGTRYYNERACPFIALMHQRARFPCVLGKPLAPPRAERYCKNSQICERKGVGVMKVKKLVGCLLAAALLVSSVAGCNSGPSTDSGTISESGDTSTVSTPADTEGDSSAAENSDTAAEGTPLELWTFQEVHRQFYESMAEKWTFCSR